ncbi:hypothetical protein [Streptomyces sp. MZ04]|uniref:hypothetical protein n=1 Tax=Streptomyces sp. MZ04 TaxID=2559236 RepID=UPI0032AF8D42
MHAAQLEEAARLLPGAAALDADRRLASAPVADRMEALTNGAVLVGRSVADMLQSLASATTPEWWGLRGRPSMRD